MYIIRRLILWLAPIVWVAGLEFVKKNPAGWWAVMIVIGLQLAATTWFILKAKGFRRHWREWDKNFLIFLILPLVFAAAGFVFVLFLVNNLGFHLIVLSIGLILYFLLRQYYLYFNLPFKYQPYSLEILSLYISLLSAYFLLTAGFGALMLMQFNLGLLLLIVIVAIGLLTFYFFWIHKVNFAKSRLYIIIILLIMMELFWAVSYLPTSYYINSFILIVAYYLMLNLTKLSLTRGLTKQRALNHVIVAGAALLMVLLTAQWD